jgi:hypothetical protein
MARSVWSRSVRAVVSGRVESRRVMVGRSRRGVMSSGVVLAWYIAVTARLGSIRLGSAG